MHKPVFRVRQVAVIAALALSASAWAAGSDGQTVFKDPQSGQVRNPTADEAKELNDLRAAQRAAAVNERRVSGAPPANIATLQPNGAVRAFLDEDSISYSVMTRNSAGELALQCVTGADAASNAMSTAGATKSKEHQHDVQ
jgi:hypothetical protein